MTNEERNNNILRKLIESQLMRSMWLGWERTNERKKNEARKEGKKKERNKEKE